MNHATIESLLPENVALSSASRASFADHFAGKIDAHEAPPDARAEWLAFARRLAVPPVSGFSVGALAIDRFGNAYPGANLEFPQAPIQCTLHAEQSAILNARAHGVTEVVELWVTALPCGHCRQFLQEMPGAETLPIIVAPQDCTHTRTSLGALLPQPFRLASAPTEWLPPSDNLANALQAAAAPYSGRKEAAALVFEDPPGFLAASNFESCAFNPSVPAIVAVLNRWNLSFRRIRKPIRVSWISPRPLSDNDTFDGLAQAQNLSASVFPGVPCVTGPAAGSFKDTCLQ